MTRTLRTYGPTVTTGEILRDRTLLADAGIVATFVLGPSADVAGALVWDEPARVPATGREIVTAIPVVTTCYRGGAR